MVLEYDSNAHSSEDENISPQTETDTDDTTNTNCTQWTDNTLSKFCTFSPQIYRESQWDMTNMGTTYY
jgi:hypothetical protein